MRQLHLTSTFLWLMLVCAALTPLGMFRPVFQDFGLAGSGVLLILAVFDFWLIPQGSIVRIEREIPDGLTTFTPIPMELRIRQTTPVSRTLRIKDHPPPEFDAVGHDQRVKAPPRRDIRMKYTVTARRRGVFDFGDVAVETPGPFGLATRRFFIPLPQSVAIYPDVKPLRQYVSLLARREEGAMGVRTKRFFGQGSSFESLRPYMEGDDPRKVDWKATARLGSLVARNYEEEPYQDVVALIDCGRRMRSLIGQKSKLDYAVDATLLLGYAAGLARDQVGVVAFD
ncbi:MAG: DUF58 domain-containing protein, partial [bacterium]